MPLTDVQLRNLKPGEKDRKISDTGGLHVLVTTHGSRLWRWSYRYLGRQRTMAFGSYPETSLAQAREKRDTMRAVLQSGRDPAEHVRTQRKERLAEEEWTFSVIADEYLDRLVKQGRAAATLEKTRWLLDFTRPALGARPITAIKATDVLDVLRKVEARGRHETARRLRSTLGTVFRYAIATARAETDPTSVLKGALIPPKVKPRAALLDPVAIGALLRAIDGYDGQFSTRAALRLLALTFVRPGELRLAEWREFDFDEAVWTVPAARMKMRQEHLVPLSRQALDILYEIKPVTGGGRFVFPGYGRGSRPGQPLGQRPISENTLNGALRRLGYSQDDMTAHGFRATASTLLNESGRWNADVIERQLAHVDGNKIRGIYNRGLYLGERVKMMAWWGDYLDQLRNGAPTRGRLGAESRRSRSANR